MRDEEIQIACMKSPLKKFCCLSEWGLEEGSGIKGRIVFFSFMNAKHLAMENNQPRLGHDM